MADILEDENKAAQEYELSAKEKFIEKIALIFCLLTCAAFFIKIVLL